MPTPSTEHIPEAKKSKPPPHDGKRRENLKMYVQWKSNMVQPDGSMIHIVHVPLSDDGLRRDLMERAPVLDTAITDPRWQQWLDLFPQPAPFMCPELLPLRQAIESQCPLFDDVVRFSYSRSTHLNLSLSPFYADLTINEQQELLSNLWKLDSFYYANKCPYFRGIRDFDGFAFIHTQDDMKQASKFIVTCHPSMW